MNTRRFFAELSLVSAATALLLYLLYYVPAIAEFAFLGWLALFLFIMLSVVMFFLGLRAARGANKNAFTTVVLGFSVAKLALSAVLILIYFQVYEPSSKWFILPFFAVYLIYTIFEVYFMGKIGKLA